MATRTKAKGIVPVLRADSAGFEKAFARLVDRRHTDTDDVEKTVRKIIDQVRDGGDAELLALVRKFDRSKIANAKQLEVTNEEQVYFKRLIAAQKLLKCWESLRLDDTLGVLASKLVMRAGGLEGVLERTKVSTVSQDQVAPVLRFQGSLCGLPAVVADGL